MQIPGFRAVFSANQASNLHTCFSNLPSVYNMKHTAQRDWRVTRPSRRNQFNFDQTTALGGLTVALLVYIVYHFIYPLISKGLLW